MKKLALVFCVAGLAGLASAQPKPVKIVFDITSGDTLIHQTALRHVTMMSAAYPQSEFEVVIYSGAIDMVLKEKSTVALAIQKLESNPRVSFKVCEATMKRHNVDKSKLLPKVGTVPDGILEIVYKQSEGWGYIKETHD